MGFYIFVVFADYLDKSPVLVGNAFFFFFFWLFALYVNIFQILLTLLNVSKIESNMPHDIFHFLY